MPHKPRPDLPSSFVSVWRALRMGYRAEPLLLIASAVTIFAAAVPDALFALGFKLFAESIVAADDRRILFAGLLLAGLAAAGWLLHMAGERVSLRFAERAAVPIESYVAKLQASVVTIEHQEHTEHRDMLWVLREHAGALSQLYRSLFLTTGAVIRVVLTVGLLVSVTPTLGLLVLFAIPTVLVSTRRGAAESRAQEAGAQGRQMARHWFVLGTTPAPGKEVRVARVQERLRQRRREEWQRSYALLSRARGVSTGYLVVVWSLFGAAFAAAVAYVALGPGTPTALAGEVTLVLAAGGRLSRYVGQTVTESHFFCSIWLDASRRLTWLEDYAAKRAGTGALPVPDRLRDGVEFHDVSFRYAGSDRLVLDGVSVKIPAGSVVALVGENGAGKTTLVKLLCRYYDPASGRITVDGRDLTQLDPGQWRARLPGTFQDFMRFELKAKQAVGLGDLPRLEDGVAVERAVDRAGAGDVVSTLAGGLDTQLGSTWHEGVDVSFGQWQKLALARGFMREDPLILALDEPTAALDAEIEHQLFERFAAASRSAGELGRITVLVSHRFSTVRMADLIVVLDGARVLEMGSHDELRTAVASTPSCTGSRRPPTGDAGPVRPALARPWPPVSDRRRQGPKAPSCTRPAAAGRGVTSCGRAVRR